MICAKCLRDNVEIKLRWRIIKNNLSKSVRPPWTGDFFCVSCAIAFKKVLKMKGFRVKYALSS